MKNKYIINWELSLNCNLNCNFCSQKEKRDKNKKNITKQEVFNIINNLAKNSHISFLWWETLLFPDIIEIFNKLEENWITYEITTNWTLLEKFFNNLISLKNLTQINISIDWYWNFHDESRWKKWLFDSIIKNIWKLISIKKITISTVITDNLEDKNLLKLYLLLNNLWINEFKLIYLMNFSKTEIINSKSKLNELNFNINWTNLVNLNNEYKKNFFKKYNLLKKLSLKTEVLYEPSNIFNRNNNVSCKQIDKQYRINEKWNLSICEFIDNDFLSLINNSFEESIKNVEYNKIKKNILSNFPLDICKTCCKNYNI